MATVASDPQGEAAHASLMDNVYRWQRHIYDATRKYFLFGRDRLIDGLDVADGAAVLEIGCGTGRNLAHVADTWPRAELYGFDISAEMLKTARARLGPAVRLAEGDACNFDPQAMFGIAQFDRVMISFALSMIPDWESALNAACDVLAPGGELHIVDFGDCEGAPPLFRVFLGMWLRHFHVSPRLDLSDRAAAAVATRRFKIRTRRGPLGYYQLIVLKRRKKD